MSNHGLELPTHTGHCSALNCVWRRAAALHFMKLNVVSHLVLTINGLSLIENVSFISVCKDPPYKVEESGYAGFILPIEVYFKNKVHLTVFLTTN